MAEVDTYRLPRNVVPKRYSLTLTPDIGAARFTGEVQIEVNVAESTNEIILNAAELEIFEADIVDEAGNRASAEVQLDATAERVMLTLESTISAGAHTLHLTFAGILNDKLRGFYNSRFIDAAGVPQTIATTQFEATEARRAFPCWDEPDFKAVFSVTLIVDDGLTAFSNTEIIENTDLGNGKRQIEFDDTIAMSTYILAFIVGPLSVTEPIDVDGVTLRVACIPGREHLTKFAIEAGAAALRFFTKYFEIPYPGNKVDMIAIPDFAAGAMENFGCITYRETALLVDTERASRVQVERVAEVVGHELAHMWFGDLVTMKWWNGLWLNEAFATFMENLFLDNFRPEWDRWTTVGVSKAAAIQVDSLHTTRPIEYEVRSPSDADAMFDVLTYEKGGSVLRMLEQYLGAETFRQGVSNYLKANAYGNAETTDLWDALDAVSDEPVRALMDTWIFQAGYPTVLAEVDHNALTLTQSRSLLLDEGTDTTNWNIPIVVRGEVNGKEFSQQTLLPGKSTTIELPGEPDWINANARATGFYAVSYSATNFSRLTSNIAKLDAAERFAVTNDAWNACLAGRVGLSDVVAMIKRLAGDNDPNVWRNLLVPVRALHQIAAEADEAAFQDFVRDLTQPNFEKLGWERRSGDSDLTNTLRGIVVGARGSSAKVAEVQAEAVERFYRYLEDSTALDADLVGPVHGILATINEARHYDTLLTRTNNSALSPQENLLALQTLGMFSNPELVTRTLDLLLSDRVKSQDAPYVLATMIANKDNGDRPWVWMEERWDQLLERFPDNSIDRMLGGIQSRYEADLLQRADEFMQSHPVPQAAKTIEQIRERLKVNAKFAQINSGLVQELLS